MKKLSDITAAAIMELTSFSHRILVIRPKCVILPVVAAVGILATSTSAMAADYVRDYNWSDIRCARIPGIVMRLTGLADHYFDKADEAREAGNEGLASAYEMAAIEATIEASEGSFAYATGDCQE